VAPLSRASVEVAQAAWRLEYERFGRYESVQPLRMTRARVGEEDILQAARDKQGLQRMDQVKYAILETNGGISIVPRQ